jgi:anti-anti-sigma factor
MSQLSPSHRPAGRKPDPPRRRWTTYPSSVFPPTLTLQGKLDGADTVDLTRLLWSLSHGGTCSLTVDVGHLQFIDLSGLHALARSADQLAFNGRHLHLVNVSPDLAQTLTLEGFDQLRTARSLSMIT